MTGERMETVREALALPGIQAAHYLPDVQAALAEVERWERDRARLEAIETAAHRVLAEWEGGKWMTDMLAATGELRDALGEGQDSDLSHAVAEEAKALPLDGVRDTSNAPTTAKELPGGLPLRDAQLPHTTILSPLSTDAVGECPCDGDRGCVCQ